MAAVLNVRRRNEMFCLCVVLTTICAISTWVTAAPVDKATRDDLDSAVGSWELIEHQFAGKKQDPSKTVVTLARDDEDDNRDDNYEIKVDGKVVEAGILDFDADVSPKAYNVTQYAKFNKPGVFRGIYKIDGDKMTLCYNTNADAKRPSEFAAKEGSTNRLYVLKRIGK
ncbi:MAG TPA: TIGR03067 domain-containing protein [Pirellulales bacterium]|jgi:uncharacterized protein (TIGR03067 family)|nr:TIGR03067 domain-containing protein [Pirellulales bacterium]